ncbi:MAG TPA: protein phosphatase 2C domain-containing protein [Capsulimonadaceae bacterium]|jgi:protein phosphatase
MEVTIGIRTDRGKRENNEDAVLVIQPKAGEIGADAIVIVADGMGGRASGEEASAMAVSSIRETLVTLLKPGPNMPSYEDALSAAMRRANSAVFELAQAGTGNKGMGTTCVAAVLGKDGAVIAHVGDSRAYLLRDGLLRRLTEDHSYIHDQVKSGHLSDHDARHSRFRHVITKAIGIDASVKPDVHIHPLAVGDSLLLCTDGMSNVVDEAGMIQIMSRARSAQESVDFLVDAAIRGGSKDNVTGALVRVGIPDAPGAPGPRDVSSAAASPAPASEPVVAPASEKRPIPRPPVWMLAGIIGILLGALLVLLIVLPQLDHRPAKPTVIAPVTRPADIAHLTYANPRILLVQPVVSNLIAGGPQGVVVAESETGNLLSINSAGQVKSAGKIDPHASTPRDNRYIAVDAQGYIYLTTPASKLIRRTDPDGSNELAIARGQLTRPEALYVDASGNIYVIDDGRLEFIKASPPTASTPRKTISKPSTGAH